jgi:hypothetical protein
MEGRRLGALIDLNLRRGLVHDTDVVALLGLPRASLVGALLGLVLIGHSVRLQSGGIVFVLPGAQLHGGIWVCGA